MNIALRFEGGLGDHILANRFVPAIRDKYPEAEISLFSSPTGGTSFQAVTIGKLFNYYKYIYVLDNISESFAIRHQFGVENYPSHISNIDNNKLRIMMSHDKFYNLHIDWLDWLSYDFDWQRYFYHFPLPTAEVDEFIFDKDYVVLHLASNNKGNNHRMSEEYISKLINSLNEEFHLFILSTPSTRDFIDSRVKESNRLTIFQEDIFKVAGLIKGCKGMLAIDSSLKYLGYTFNKPTLCWAKEAIRPHQVPYAYQIRWLTFPQLCFPLEHDTADIKKCLKNLIETDNFFLAPHIQNSDLSKALINRELTNIPRNQTK
jgi:ADP-heptose:LPS heptosyltransferase